MVSRARAARLNSPPLISLSARSLQANIYQLIGLKAAPLGGPHILATTRYGPGDCLWWREPPNKGRSPSSTPLLPYLASPKSLSPPPKKLLILSCPASLKKVELWQESMIPCNAVWIHRSSWRAFYSAEWGPHPKKISGFPLHINDPGAHRHRELKAATPLEWCFKNTLKHWKVYCLNEYLSMHTGIHDIQLQWD